MMSFIAFFIVIIYFILKNNKDFYKSICDSFF